MIATKPKDFEELLNRLAEADSIYIVGCGDCATVLQTGGEYEVAEMKKKLEDAGKTVSGTIVPDITCQVLDIKRLLRGDKEAIQSADAILVMACGAGVQAVAEIIDDREVFAALDTTFAADKFRGGEFYEWCSLCGECIVDQYGGVCPVTRCPKGQLNGPCGGSEKGKCEVDTERDCVWTLIYNRLDKVGDKQEIEDRMAEPKDHEKSTKPHEYVFEARRG